MSKKREQRKGSRPSSPGVGPARTPGARPTTPSPPSRRVGSGRGFRWPKYTPWIAFGVMVVAVVVVVALVAGRGGSSDASKLVEGVGTPVPLLSPEHVPTGQQVLGYNSTPPASGPHWEKPARCGVYEEPVPDEAVLHNLEHGSVVISHNLGEPQQVAELTGIARKLSGWGRWGVLRPYAKLGKDEVAITAWGVMDRFAGIDEARLQRFWNTYAHNRLSDETKREGPIPCS